MRAVRGLVFESVVRNRLERGVSGPVRPRITSYAIICPVGWRKSESVVDTALPECFTATGLLHRVAPKYHHDSRIRDLISEIRISDGLPCVHGPSD
jgi:hypothetical protein